MENHDAPCSSHSQPAQVVRCHVSYYGLSQVRLDSELVSVSWVSYSCSLPALRAHDKGTIGREPSTGFSFSEYSAASWTNIIFENNTIRKRCFREWKFIFHAWMLSNCRFHSLTPANLTSPVICSFCITRRKNRLILLTRGMLQLAKWLPMIQGSTA